VLILEGAFSESYEKAGVSVLSLARRYAKKARFVVTAGTCATFGGMFKAYDPDAISGFAFDGEAKTPRYDETAEKLISLPGCPVHPRWLAYVLTMIARAQTIRTDALHRPVELFGYTVHNGCLRNEYFEWKIDTHGFGTKEGCMFYESGCQGPYTRGSCNKILWNDVSSKTRAGTPCFGCTEPDFPQRALFTTKTHMGIPERMPLGVPKRAYLTLTGVAKSFRIKRFMQKLTEYEV
jgi:hydrogenase small subunit